MESKIASNGKVKIYLADLVHNWIGRGPFMFPINIGYLKSYLRKFHGDYLETRLFKYPGDLIKAVEQEPPNIIGLSNYAWNEDLDLKLMQYFKAKHPNIVTVMGGPNINIPTPNIDFDEMYTIPGYLSPFLKNNPNLDFYVILTGEKGFLNLVNRYMEFDGDIKKMKKSVVEGVAFYNRELDEKEAIRGKDLIIKDLTEVPSPYLTGVMDEFFNNPLIPNIETDRGCPYPCTFCAWGNASYQKMAIFQKDRIMEELEYISDMVGKTKKTNILCIANANFGILEQDLDYAKKLRQLFEEKGYPRKVTTFWAKNKGKRVIEIAKVLGGDLISVDASLQSTNPATLKAIKRDNISQDDYKMFLRYLNKIGVDSDGELIIGLPQETRESFFNAVKDLFEERAGQIVTYHCRILKGAEMSDPRDLKKYGVKTKWRLIDTQYGEYENNGENFKAIEAEEMVKFNNTMSEEDLFYFRDLGWLIQFTWNYKYHRGLLEYGLSHNINPANFLDYALKNVDKAPKKVQKLINDFRTESRDEWFPTKEDLVEHYSKSENWDDLKHGGFGKLNFKYTFRTLLECTNEFDQYILQVAKELISKKIWDKKSYEQAINDVAGFESMLRIDFAGLDINKKFSVNEEKFGDFGYDILRWRLDAYERNLHEYKAEEPIVYRFYLPKDQIDALNNNLNQFKNINPNFTLRKMSEYMRISDLFYKVESLEDSSKYEVKIENLDFHTSKFAQ